MEESVVKYIRELDPKKQKIVISLFKTLAEPNDQELGIEFESSGFKFEDLRILHSNLFRIVFDENKPLLKNILQKL